MPFSAPSPLPVWHDCDPGHDDAVTLLTLLGREDVQLLGISTTHGNAPLSATTRNARALLTLAHREDVPVYAGAAAPLVREPVYAPEIHGASGLGGVALPDPQREVRDEHAALALIRQLCAQPGEISVLATGPLTNLALAERLRPGVLRQARQIIVMGGSLEGGAPKLGNVTPRAEFNAYADPHAFHVAVHAGANLVLLGLNLTRQVQVTRQRAAQLAAVGTRAALICAAFLNDYLDRIGKLGQRVGALHDPCTAALLLAPDLFEVEAARVEIVTDSGERLGETRRVDGPPNLKVVTEADEEGVYALVATALGRLP